MTVAVVIPAYEPTKSLTSLVEYLSNSDIGRIIVVDDGGGSSYTSIFQDVCRIPKVELLCHPTNQGKGAALKTAMRHILAVYPDYAGIVTVDADGQHAVEDALAISQLVENHQEHLILGVRTFQQDIPLKSFVGNNLTKIVTRLLYGNSFSDTQTGLRGIPKSLIPIFLDIDYDRYEYEMEMLIQVSQRKIGYLEHPIKTIYIDGNASSHFNPLADSMRIYLVLLRYVLASLSTALIDYTTFFVITTFLTKEILIGTYSARLVALLYNYSIVNRLVFRSGKTFAQTFPLYLSLVAVSGFLSASATRYLVETLGTHLLLSKAIAELALYLAIFFIQKELIFRRETR